MGKLFSKPKMDTAPTPAAAPAPVAEGAQKEQEENTSRKKKKQGKVALMVEGNNAGLGSGGTGINL